MSACYNANWKRRFPRWVNRLYAKAFSYFWLPCDMCGRDFGGHEVANESLIDPKSRFALRYTDGSLGGEIGRSVCWRCHDEVRIENERRAQAIVAGGGKIDHSPDITLGPGESVSFVFPIGTVRPTPTPRALFAAAVLDWWWNDPKTPSIQAVVASLRQEESPDGTRPVPLALPEHLERMGIG